MTGWRWRIPWRTTIATLGVASLLAASTIGLDALRGWINPRGVLIVDNVVVRKGNGDGFAPAFTAPLPSGAEFALVEQRPGWYCIRIGDGQTGWVRACDAMIAGRGS